VAGEAGAMRTLRTAAVAAILVLTAMVLVPGSAAAAPSCGAVVTTTTTVTANLTDCPGDGLIIGAHNITLNLNGRTVDGVGLGVGIRNNGFDNVTIRNGAVTGFDH